MLCGTYLFVLILACFYVVILSHVSVIFVVLMHDFCLRWILGMSLEKALPHVFVYTVLRSRCDLGY